MKKKIKKNISVNTKKKKNKISNELRGLFTFKGEDGKSYSLTMKQKLFVESYLEFKGNGVDAVIEAGYDCSFPNGSGTNRKLAASIAYENLIKPDIITYINIKLDEYGFNDDNVKKQHLFLLNQDADLSAKKGAIDMFYKIGGNYAPERLDVRGILSEFDEVSNSQLLKKKTTSRHSTK